MFYLTKRAFEDAGACQHAIDSLPRNDLELTCSKLARFIEKYRKASGESYYPCLASYTWNFILDQAPGKIQKKISTYLGRKYRTLSRPPFYSSFTMFALPSFKGIILSGLTKQQQLDALFQILPHTSLVEKK